MNVVKFPRVTTQLPMAGNRPNCSSSWRPAADAIAAGEASGWEVGVTENGDPQVYLIGPPPDHDCILCISRVWAGSM